MPEESYKHIADEYLREYGARLRREMDDLEMDPVGWVTPEFDGRVRRAITAYKRARYAKYAGIAVAACLVVVLASPLLTQNLLRQSASSSLLSPNAPAAETPVAPSTSPATAPSTPAAPPQAKPSAPAAVAPSLPPAASYELLPLSFNMPAQFTVASIEQDAEKTVYHLTDNYLDNVILTLERTGDISRYDTLAALSIGGRRAYGSSGGGYNLLAFADEGSDILYVLTCKYDINTLVVLSRSILA